LHTKYCWSEIRVALQRRREERKPQPGRKRARKCVLKREWPVEVVIVFSQARFSLHQQHSQHALQLAPQELAQVKHLAQAQRTPQAVARRAGLIEAWYIHPNWSTKQFAQALSRHENWVRKWRHHWSETHSLQDAPRSGAPRRFSPEVRAQVTAVACSLPRSHGLPLTHWSRAELARLRPEQFPPYRLSQPGPLAVGGLLSRSVPGVFTLGNTFRTRRSFSYVLDQCSASMSRRERCSIKASGSSVAMRKPRSKRGRQSKHLVQQCLNILCTSHLVLIGVEP
jgi:transposase